MEVHGNYSQIIIGIHDPIATSYVGYKYRYKWLIITLNLQLRYIQHNGLLVLFVLIFFALRKTIRHERGSLYVILRRWCDSVDVLA